MIGQREPDAAGGDASPIDPQRPNVVAFPGSSRRADPFDQLTARLVMGRHKAGTLDPAIVEALLMCAGLET